MEHRERGEMTQYRRELEIELRLHPNNLDARYNLALLLEDSGHIADALELYRDNLQRGRHLPTAINLAQLLRRQGKTAEAETILKQSTKQFRHEATPWYLLAEISQQRHNPAEADQCFQLAIRTDRHNGYARLHYARFLASQGRPAAAAREGQKAVDLLPQCAPCWRSLGDILRKSGKNDGALAAYQRSLAIQPDVDTRQRLIDTLQLLGQHDRARLMQKALNAWRQSHPE